MTAVAGEVNPRPRDKILDRAGDKRLARLCRSGHARTDVNCSAANLLARQLDFAGVYACPNLDPKPTHGGTNTAGAANGPGWPVKGREEPISRGVDLLAAESDELPSNHSVMCLTCQRARILVAARGTSPGETS